jgi:hypothetical protein
MAAHRKYNIQDLNVGETVLLNWRTGHDGTHMTANQLPLHIAVWREEKKHQKKFRREPCGMGLRVTRIE